MTRKTAVERALEFLNLVGLGKNKRVLNSYPHELSGGMRQRVMISMALACRPRLLIADEPTTALDVTIQAQILDLMKGLQDELSTAIIMITHDLGVIAETAHRVVVMYTGKIMETSSTLELFDHPLHPYTRGLMSAIPSVGKPSGEDELYEIKGTVPSLLELPPGCKFNSRCDRSQKICTQREPELREVCPDHWVACWEANHAGVA